MKPTVLIAVTFITAFVIGMGGMHLYHRPTSTEQGQSQVAAQPKAHTALVDQRPSMTKSIASHQTGSEAVKDSPRPIPARNINAVDTNRLEAVRLKQKLMKRSGNYEYRAWRVDVKNNTNEIVKVYVEIEWLDQDGFRVDHSTAVRKLGPGTHSISEVEMMELDDAAKVKTVRFVKMQDITGP